MVLTHLIRERLKAKALILTEFFFLFTDHHYGRAVIMFGIPYVYTQSRILKVSDRNLSHFKIFVLHFYFQAKQIALLNYEFWTQIMVLYLI